MNEVSADTLVPINWLFYVASVMIGLVFLWLRHEFRKNDEQHKESGKAITGIHKRIDHLILHLLPGRPYKEPESDNGNS